jgi:hypothetical protein
MRAESVHAAAGVTGREAGESEYHGRYDELSHLALLEAAGVDIVSTRTRVHMHVSQQCRPSRSRAVPDKMKMSSSEAAFSIKNKFSLQKRLMHVRANESSVRARSREQCGKTKTLFNGVMAAANVDQSHSAATRGFSLPTGDHIAVERTVPTAPQVPPNEAGGRRPIFERVEITTLPDQRSITTRADVHIVGSHFMRNAE